MSCRRYRRSVEYALEDSQSDDRCQAVIDAALDEQELDLDSNNVRIDYEASVDEAS